MTLVKMRERTAVCMWDLFLLDSIFWNRGVIYLFIKTIDPDELPEIHYCLAGGAWDLRPLAAEALRHPAHEILNEAFKRTRVSQG